MSPAPSMKHQYVSLQLSWALADYVLGRDAGIVFTAPFDVRFDLYNQVQPDIVVVMKEHRERLDAAGLRGVPDLVVEILSPATRGVDLVKNAALYATHAVQEYWIVDPEDESVVAHTLRDECYEVIQPRGGAVVSELLSGFTVEPEALFRLPDWVAE